MASTVAALVFLGCAFLFFWNRDRRSTWLLWWAVPFLIGGAAVASYLRPNWESDYLTIGIGNAVRLGAIAMFWHGARVFERRDPIIIAVLVAPLIWMGLCSIPGFVSSLPARVIGVSLLNGIYCSLAAYELWRGRAERLASRMPAVLVFLSFAALMLIRIAAVNLLPFPMGALPLDPLWMGLFNLAVFIHATFLGFLLIALTKERQELEQRNFAMLDPLTGLMNRRAFMKQAERTRRRHNDRRDATALLLLDLDHFKAINDRFGHEIGDRVLQNFAAVTESCLRPTDQLYRLGGEEFCLVLPDTERMDAIAVSDRVRLAFAASAVELGKERVSATVSIGLATAPDARVHYDDLLAAADAAVYEAKARGRNRVVAADPTALRQPVHDAGFGRMRRSA